MYFENSKMIVVALMIDGRRVSKGVDVQLNTFLEAGQTLLGKLFRL
jgi:hypothetical protein